MNLSSIPLREFVDLQSRQGESRMVEKFAETRAILIVHEEGGKGGHCEDWRETLLMNTGSTNQPSEEQLQPQNSPGQRDSLNEDVVNQSPKDASQQLQDYSSLSMTPAQETPRPVQDMTGLTKHKPRPTHDVPIAESSSRPRRERRRPAYLTDYVT